MQIVLDTEYNANHPGSAERYILIEEGRSGVTYLTAEAATATAASVVEEAEITRWEAIVALIGAM